MSNYRPNVARHLRDLIAELGPIGSLLDFGAGNGWMLSQVLTVDAQIDSAKAIDVQKRSEYHFPVELYDGDRLPFGDRSFDATMAVDVLHHCPDPAAGLREAARVTDRFIIIKDHTYRTPVGFATLSILDEIGNWKFGIPSRYKYQKDFSWDLVLAQEGFGVRHRVNPLPCHDGLLSFTDRLQCGVIYERTSA